MPKQSIKVARTCEVCGAVFETYPAFIAKGLGRYCNRVCTGAAKRAAPRRMGAKLTRTCEVCGTSFEMFPSRLLRGDPGRWCGLACSRQGRKAETSAKNTALCIVCGAPFVSMPYERAERNRQCCSKRCVGMSQRGAGRPLEERFWLRVDKDGPIVRPDLDACWVWTGRREAFGYGTIYRTFPNRVRANRVAWEIATGETLTDDDIIGHVCDDPPCVRNDSEGVYIVRGVTYERRGHLWRTTPTGNAHDMVDKGRHKPYGRAPKR